MAALTPATALALPPVLLAFATALAEAELELPRQLFTVGLVATAAEKASAVPELCASEAASAHTYLQETWDETNLAVYYWSCLHELPRLPHTKELSILTKGRNGAHSCQRGCSGLLRLWARGSPWRQGANLQGQAPQLGSRTVRWQQRRRTPGTAPGWAR